VRLCAVDSVADIDPSQAGRSQFAKLAAASLLRRLRWRGLTPPHMHTYTSNVPGRPVGRFLPLGLIGGQENPILRIDTT